MSSSYNNPEVQEGKFFALISYLSFLCIFSLVLKNDNKFAVFHGKQGLVLFVFEVATFLISIIPILGAFLGRIGIVVFGLTSLWQILQVLMGNYSRIPIISDIAGQIVL